MKRNSQKEVAKVRKIELVLFDFDKTITNCHTYNEALASKMSVFTFDKGLILNGEAYGKIAICEEYSKENVQLWAKNFFEKENRFIDIEKQVEFFRDLMEKNIKIAIVSHTRYPGIIDEALKFMGFSEKEISEIDVICGLPNNMFVQKNEHIELAKERADIKEYTDILLIDDAMMNTLRARQLGCETIFIPEAGIYLDAAKEIITKSENGCLFINNDEDNIVLDSSDEDFYFNNQFASSNAGFNFSIVDNDVIHKKEESESLDKDQQVKKSYVVDCSIFYGPINLTDQYSNTSSNGSQEVFLFDSENSQEELSVIGLGDGQGESLSDDI